MGNILSTPTLPEIFLYREGLGGACAGTLKHHTLVGLDTLLVAFLDLIVYGDRIACFESRELFRLNAFSDTKFIISVGFMTML